MRPLAALAGLLCILPGAIAARAETPRDPISVLAAASLMAPLAVVEKDFIAAERAGPTMDRAPILRMIYGSSGSLARRIIALAPADVFVSADARWMDAVEKAGRLTSGSRRALARNSLVLAAPADSSLVLDLVKGADLAGALADGRLATADPDHAPLGAYARRALQWIGAWPEVERRLVRVADAAQARVMVERGAVAAAILYASDVTGNPRLRTVAAFPPESHPPVVYEIALIRPREPSFGHHGAAERYLDALLSARGQEIFSRHGFGAAAAATEAR